MLQTLTSMRTAIYMMLSIIGIALAATLLFPGADIFSSLWFRLLLALVCVNMAFCKFRLGRNLLAVSSAGPRTPPGPHWQRQELAGVTAADLAAMLQQKGYRIAAEEKEGKTVLHADKHLAGRWGTLAVHIAVLLIAAGALTGNLLGFTQTVTVGQAETVALPLDRNGGRQAELTLRDFRIEYYPDGSVSEYISDLTVAADGDVRQQTVRINHPLDYQGISLYQMDHGHQVLARRQSPGGAVLTEAWLADSGRLAIDDAAGLSLAVLGYVPDFDPRRPAVSRSPFPNNPRVLYAFYRQNEAVDWGVAALGQTLILQGYDSTVTFPDVRPYSVFEAKSDPGLPAVMSGFVLLSLASFASLLLRYHQLCVTVSAGPRGPRADMAVGRLAAEPAQLLLDSLAEAAKGGSKPC